MAKEPQKKLAVCIGINYVGTPNELAGCINDANDWAAELNDRGFNVHSLIESDATKGQILDALREMVNRLGRGDVLVVTNSSHGTYVRDTSGDEPDGTDEAMCPYDLPNLVLDDELYDVFSQRAVGSRVVMISDSCFSGTLNRMMAPVSTQGPGRRARFLPPTEDWLPKRLVPRATKATAGAKQLISSGLLLSGCNDREYSYDAHIDGRARGAASWAYLTALKQNPTTYSQWIKFVRESYLPSQDYPQSPGLYGTSSQKKWKVLA